jgi:proteic killer suppression protein
MPGRVWISLVDDEAEHWAAGWLDDLSVPPRNRLEVSKGDRKGQMSIRIINQWRVFFRWTAAGPADVEMAYYH